MTKKDIARAIAEETGLSQLQTHEIVQKTFDAVLATLITERRIELRGFGVFQVKPRKRGIGRNPRTGKEVRIPPGRTIRFKPGKDLQNIG